MAQPLRKSEPSMQPSDEASSEEIELAKSQGKAMQRAVQYMTQKEAHGAVKPAGDYLVGYAVEKAEGLYYLRDGTLQWQEPEQENVHVEVAVLDGSNGRFVPALTVHATLIDSNGQEIGTHLQPFLWHPWLYHYGRNWRVPGDGVYTLKVRIDVPDFPRHDKINGKRFAEPVEVEFREISIQTGRKKS